MKLSKEHQKKLLLTALITAVALGGLWFGLIRMQNTRLAKLQTELQNAEQKRHDFDQKINMAAQVEKRLEEARKELGALEANMAAGDPYIWMVDSVRQFKLGYKDIDIRQFSSIVLADSSTLLPKFPYKQATITITGTGYYHDIGRFVADMENRFPHLRLQNLVIEHLPAATDDREKLLFRVDVVALVKS